MLSIRSQRSKGGDVVENEDRTVLEIKDLYVQYNTDDAVVHAVNGLNLTL